MREHTGRFAIVVWVAGLLLMAGCLWILADASSVPSCTIITLAHGNAAFFANNEDWHSPDPVIGFYPASSKGYGSMHVGFRHRDGGIEFGGAMNDQGLAWDINSLPDSSLNPHPERPYSHAADNYLSTITRQAATVEDAVRIAGDFDFGDSLALQIHVADATGDAVVISAGPDGELAFTRKAPGAGYLVSTNFNLANHDNGTKGWRYVTAVSKLEEFAGSQAVSPEDLGAVMDVVHLENLTSYTLYSNIFDLKNGMVHLYYMAQYDEMLSLDLAEETAKGQQVVEMRDLFSAETVTAGQRAYRRFETRFTATKIAAVVGTLIVVVVGVLLFRRRKLSHPKG